MRNENILSREAVPVEGTAEFLNLGVKFAYGADSPAYRDRRVSKIHRTSMLTRRQISSIQACSLTGALRIAGTFLARFPSAPTRRVVYVPSPTAEEDVTALREAGLDVRSFSYLDRKSGTVDFENVREDLQVRTLYAEVSSR